MKHSPEEVRQMIEDVIDYGIKYGIATPNFIKLKKMSINSMIESYLPADYTDSFSRIITCERAMMPEEFRNLAFTQLPTWVDWLMKLRNAIVKPLGLDTNGKFTDMICASSSNEDIYGMPDKHLDFHVSIWCGEYKEGKQELRITTVVKYNNWFGRIYFFIIKPFHTVIIRSILNTM